ncbi:MAG: tol-pal system protein YbgF [bacterium]
MNKNIQRVFGIAVIIGLVSFLGCQTNGVKETVQRNLDDLQKQIFEIQQDQAYLNTKVEQTTAQLTSINERIGDQDKKLDDFLVVRKETMGYAPPPQVTAAPSPPVPVTPQPIKEKRVEPPPQPKEQARPAGSPSKLYTNALDLVRSGRIDDAVPLLQLYLEEYPRTELADNALYWLGECYYKKTEYNKAIGEFKRILSEYPAGNKVPAALLKMGFSYQELQQTPQALESYQRIVKDFPNDPVYPMAQKRIDLILSERVNP